MYIYKISIFIQYDLYIFSVYKNEINEEQRCCRCVEIRVGIFLLGLWSITVTIAYYIGFEMILEKDSRVKYPKPVLYFLALLGFIGGSFGIFASIFNSILISKMFLIWAVIRFFACFAEGILYAAAGYSLYIMFFIDFVIWGYWIIVINQFIQLLQSKKLFPLRGLNVNNYYQSTSS